jgi:Uma2 family endonuclease
MIEPLKKLYTVTEYYALVDEGVLREDDRVELIEGEIRHMPPIGSPHSGGVNRLAALFFGRLSGRAVISVQGPVRLSEISEPQPDLLLLRFREDFYASRHPHPEDVLLLVEVADSSLGYDQGTKAPLYARHGIPEVWIEALNRTTLVVYRNPSPQGYRDVRTFHRGERISPLAFPDLVLEVSAILG